MSRTLSLNELEMMTPHARQEYERHKADNEYRERWFGPPAATGTAGRTGNSSPYYGAIYGSVNPAYPIVDGSAGGNEVPHYSRTTSYDYIIKQKKDLQSIISDFLVDCAKFGISVDQIVLDTKSFRKLDYYMNISRSVIDGYTKLQMHGPLGLVTISDAVVPKFERFDMDKYMEKTDEKLP